VPAVKIFQQLRDRVKKQDAMLPAEKRAMFWFHDYATALTQWQRKFKTVTYPQLRQDDFTKELVGADRAMPGFFYFFMYDPKTKVDLPYYDRFPFVLCLDNQHGRFRGLNFHYLDYLHRARLFDLLYPFRMGRPARPNVRDIRMRLKVTYSILKISSKYKAFKPCFKEYLVPHVQTPLMKVGAKEWDVALFLPVEMFVKQNKQQVWKESNKQFQL
jgi:hypothetical protein